MVIKYILLTKIYSVEVFLMVVLVLNLYYSIQSYDHLNMNKEGELKMTLFLLMLYLEIVNWKFLQDSINNIKL